MVILLPAKSPVGIEKVMDKPVLVVEQLCMLNCDQTLSHPTLPAEQEREEPVKVRVKLVLS